MSEEALRVHALTVRYPQRETCALKDVSLSLHPGTLCALVGANGAGKSTLLKAMVGMLRPVHGSVSYGGRGLHDALRKGVVSYVSQLDGTDGRFPLSVEDVVMMGRYGRMNLMRHPAEVDRDAVEEALRRTGLVELRHRQVSELSGGQSKRMFVARGIAQGARVLLMDEPFAGVDKHSEAVLLTLMEELAGEGAALLVSVHDLHMAAHSFGNVILLDRCVIGQGSAREVLKPQLIARAFGMDASEAQRSVA